LELFNAVLLGYADHLKIRNYSPNTAEHYLRDLKEFLRFLLDEQAVTRVQDVTKDILKVYQQKIFAQTRKRDGKPLSLRSKHHKLMALRNFFGYLVKKSEILYNPALSLELPKLRRDNLRDALKEREVKRILDSFKRPCTSFEIRDKAILELFYSTGIRNTELRLLEVSDLDLERGELKILHAKGYFGEKQRVIPVGRVALACLEDYLVNARPKLLKDPGAAVLFVTKSGKPLRVEDPNDIVKRCVLRSGLKRNVYPHLFRHSFATHLLRHGADIRYVQEMLGHESLNSTQVYTKLEISDLKKIHHKTHPREREC